MRRLVWVVMVGFMLAGCGADSYQAGLPKALRKVIKAKNRSTIVKVENPKVQAMLANARYQIEKTKAYDPDYSTLKYPNGDVPIEKGVCSDVLVRALRAGGVDPQRLVHEDMIRNFAAYPRLWGLNHADANIDHRRVPNLMTWMRRLGKHLEPTRDRRDYLPGDFVIWRMPDNRYHCAIVSDRLNDDGTPLEIHNVGAGIEENNRLFAWTVIDHDRFFLPNEPTPKPS